MIKRVESSLENFFNKQAAECGFLSLKISIIARNGFPDRTLIGKKSHIFFVELKRPNGKKPKPERHQIYWHNLLKKLGFSVYVVNDKKEIKRIFRREKRKQMVRS